jgi:hypothetical protein
VLFAGTERESSRSTCRFTGSVIGTLVQLVQLVLALITWQVTSKPEVI